MSSDIWCQLNGDVFSLILQRLTRIELIRLSAVCSSWRGIIREYISSQSGSRVPPWLILPSDIKKGEDIDGCHFYSSDEKTFYKQRKSVCKGFGKRHCIGSSHGWLILLDESFNPYLLNPFSSIRIPLPPFIVEGEDESYVLFDGSSVNELGDSFYHKSILSSSPYNNNKYVVILVYDNKSKLAYSKHGEWKNLEGASQGCYCDVICRNNRVYALSTSTSMGCSSSIEIWDFQNSLPVKLMQVIDPPLPELLQARMELWNHKEINTKQYLAEYLGNILLVIRFVVNMNAPKCILHYYTYDFTICRFDFELKKWIGVDDSFKTGCILFLGANHSISLPAEYFPNSRKHSVSVYYTDDDVACNRYQSVSSGHDMGIMTFMGIGEDNLWDDFSGIPLDRENPKIEPSPLWVLPNPW